MISNRVGIILYYDERQEVASGVYENNIVGYKVKAERLQVYQKRLNEAELLGLVVTARLKIRNYNIDKSLKYVDYLGNRYKVNSIYNSVSSHNSEIELGELV